MNTVACSCGWFFLFAHNYNEWLAIETNESNCDRYIACNCIEIDQMKPTILRLDSKSERKTNALSFA